MPYQIKPRDVLQHVFDKDQWPMHSFEMKDLVESLKKILYLIPMTHEITRFAIFLKTQMEWFHCSCALI